VVSEPTLFEEAPVEEAQTGQERAADAAPALVVVVHGIPGPQGSKSHKGGGRMVESSAKVKPWRVAVVDAAVEARQKVEGYQPLTGAVALSMTFTLARPKSHFGTGRNAGVLRPSAPRRPSVKPDLSKLVRATEDALTTALVYRDDAQVVDYVGLGKYYETDHGTVPDVLDSPGCVIRVWALPERGAS
jgi:Holliday junction resolvase RusA-like endonuclease